MARKNLKMIDPGPDRDVCDRVMDAADALFVVQILGHKRATSQFHSMHGGGINGIYRTIVCGIEVQPGVGGIAARDEDAAAEMQISWLKAEADAGRNVLVWRELPEYSFYPNMRDHIRMRCHTMTLAQLLEHLGS